MHTQRDSHTEMHTQRYRYNHIEIQPFRNFVERYSHKEIQPHKDARTHRPARTLVVARAETDGVNVAEVRLHLRVDERVAVHLRGRRQQEARLWASWLQTACEACRHEPNKRWAKAQCEVKEKPTEMQRGRLGEGAESTRAKWKT